ncbi:MAG TPA: DUF2231 domain-containing protein [Burkholderiaceae bacterium]|nr:DUF2231 domain-containing protein [Burkholderiaceae bacterium]
MESRHTFMGHPLHQMLIVFPLGLLGVVPVFDAITLFGGDPIFSRLAYWNIAAGLIGGVIAAIFGFLDWMQIPKGTRAERVGTLHGLGNMGVLALFFVAFMMRRSDPEHLVDMRVFIVEVLAFALAGLTGWLGAELVNRLGVGVADNAHLDAPSSLDPRTAEAVTSAKSSPR